ncbi:hypothetical protein ES702_04788 [subsurface metagenome]
MANKNPRCRMVSVPNEFMPLLEAELNSKGYFSYPQLMNDILTRYFNGKGIKPKPAILIKEVGENDKENS